MLEDVYQMMLRLGLKENEIKVYLTCLENKQGLFVSEFTKKTAIKRSSVILILDRLIQKGLVTHHLEGMRKIFFAEQPETWLFSMENSLQDFRAIIPLLRATAGGNNKTRVRFFEGKEGIEKIFNDILQTMKMSRDPKKEICAISSSKDIFESLPAHEKNYVNKRIKEGIYTRWIAPDCKASRALDKKSPTQRRKTKFFNPAKYGFNIEFQIYDGKIGLISFQDGLSGVIVENKSFADSFRCIFNLLWDSLR